MNEYERFVCGSTSTGAVWFLPNYVVNQYKFVSKLVELGIAFETEECTNGLLIYELKD